MLRKHVYTVMKNENCRTRMNTVIEYLDKSELSRLLQLATAVQNTRISIRSELMVLWSMLFKYSLVSVGFGLKRLRLMPVPHALRCECNG